MRCAAAGLSFSTTPMMNDDVFFCEKMNDDVDHRSLGPSSFTDGLSSSFHVRLVLTMQWFILFANKAPFLKLVMAQGPVIIP
jgi:hypothetical protein